MNKQDFIAQIQASDISDSNKERILSLLAANEFDQDCREKIKDIIQEDIDSMDNEVLTDEDRAAITAATEEMSAQLAEVEKELQEDVAFVERETAELEAVVAEADKVTDQIEIDAIKAKMQS